MQYNQREYLPKNTISAIEILEREFAGGAEVWTAERSLLKRGGHALQLIELGGVEFIDENRGCPGVRLRKRQRLKKPK
jgi:hypothetical protein